MARKTRGGKKLTPNTKGPQIQIKDKRNAYVRDTHREVTDNIKNKLEAEEAGILEGIDLADDALQASWKKYNRYNQYTYDHDYNANQKKGILSKPKGSAYNKGDYTGATRAPHPTVFRRFGGNTRERVYPFEKQGTKLTGLLDNHYDPKVLSPPGPQDAARRFFPSGATPIQGGCPAVLKGVSQLRPGSGHWLFS